MKMMKLKNKVILKNVLAVLLVVAVLCFVIAQGIYFYSFDTYASELGALSKEIQLFLSQSINSSSVMTDESDMFRSNIDTYYESIKNNYSYSMILYDDEVQPIASSLQNSENMYIAQANTVFETQKQAYIYTEVGTKKQMIYFSPIVVNQKKVGVIALIKPTTSITELVDSIIYAFCYSAVALAIICWLTSSIMYNRVMRPINSLVKNIRNVAKGDTIEPLHINYEVKDEVSELIDSVNLVNDQLEKRISELKVEKEKINGVISSLDDGVIALNLSSEIIMTNRKLGEIFKNVNDYQTAIPDMIEIINQVSKTRDSVSKEFVYENKNYLMKASLIASSSESQDGILIVIKDISAVKKVEEEQNKFISSVSHELKTPLTTIIGYISLLKRRGTTDSALTQKALGTMEKEAQRLLRLVSDLLNINRYNSLDFDFVFTNIDTNMLIAESVEEMSLSANEKSMMINYIPSELPQVLGDYDRLKQVLLNIIDNSLKYSNENDIVKVTASFDENNLDIFIRDFGCGIDPERKDKIFDTFYRVEEDRSRLRGGFGIGLSIVSHIVQRHNGEIKVESVLGEGTLMQITLPLAVQTNNSSEVEDDED